MKKLTTLLFALIVAVSVFAQDDPASLSVRKTFQHAILPGYASGGFKVLVKNNTTGELEVVTYTVIEDTLNGIILFIANGASNKAWQVTTPITYKTLISAFRNGISADMRLYDTSGNKYLDFNSNDGITVFDTLWCNAKTFRVETITGTKSITADSNKFRIDCNKMYMGTGGIFYTSGSGTPLYHINAPVGSMYTRTDGVTDSVLYIKMVGATDSAGWYPLKH